MTRTLLTTILFLCCSLLASAKELRTITFKVEQMVCVNCEAKVKREIPYIKGIKKMKTSIENKTVVITFDAEKTSIEDIQKGFAKFGYKAEPIEPQAAPK